ncbi:MAG: allantoate amidohydrolase [Mycobacteriales bacterium]
MPENDPVSFDGMWSALAPVGRDPGTGGYRRLAWTGTDAVLREWFAGEAARCGLALSTDRAGNQWAWWGAPDSAGPGLALGSHLDSVPDGGAYDGPLGVVSAFAALDLLRERGFTPRRPVGVASFADEEGARFGVACAGSRLLTGALDADRALALTDGDGITLAEALTRAGRDPATVGPDDGALRRIGTFVELHVEQGRGLADLGRAVAVGSSIRPHGRWRLDLAGAADHAGTTRLEDRRDPMLALAALVVAARESAAARGCVATVGKVAVQPNAVNAVPSHVTAWLDARGPDADRVRSVVAAVEVAAGAPAREESFTPDIRFDPALVARLARLLGDAPVLPTAAGHDAGILAAAGIPTAMLFVRNPTGVSHSPAEHAERADCLAGVEALAAVVEALCGVVPSTGGAGRGPAAEPERPSG